MKFMNLRYTKLWNPNISPFITNGSAVELIKLDIKTLTNTKTYYLGFDSGLSKDFAIKATMNIKIIFDIDETSDAPICIKLE